MDTESTEKIPIEDGAEKNDKSVKRAKQLHYYGPEFLKLLGISYMPQSKSRKDFDNENKFAQSRSLSGIRSKEAETMKDDDTTEKPESIKDSFLSSLANAAGSQLGVSLASNGLGRPQVPSHPIQSLPTHNGNLQNSHDNNYDYNDDEDYDETGNNKDGEDN